jgi:Rrf2 family iron-sulfur cluster assembly transcriptional regulator
MLRRKTATYALLALYEIAIHKQKPGGSKGVRAGDISDRHELPRAYAAKILSQLSSAGILHSDRGPRGGFRLGRDPDSVSLFEVFNVVGAIESFDSADDSLDGFPEPVRKTLQRIMDQAQDAFRLQLESVSLLDVVAQHNAATVYDA